MDVISTKTATSDPVTSARPFDKITSRALLVFILGKAVFEEDETKNITKWIGRLRAVCKTWRHAIDLMPMPQMCTWIYKPESQMPEVAEFTSPMAMVTYLKECPFLGLGITLLLPVTITKKEELISNFPTFGFLGKWLYTFVGSPVVEELTARALKWTHPYPRRGRQPEITITEWYWVSDQDLVVGSNLPSVQYMYCLIPLEWQLQVYACNWFIFLMTQSEFDAWGKRTNDTAVVSSCP